MLRKNNISKRTVALACMALLLVYTAVVFLPHSHDCIYSECTACGLIETSRNMLMGIELIAAVYSFARLGLIILIDRAYGVSVREETLVGLKVKLSD